MFYCKNTYHLHGSSKYLFTLAHGYLKAYYLNNKIHDTEREAV